MEQYNFREGNTIWMKGIFYFAESGHILGPKGQKQVATAICWKCGKNITA
jgi:hypothetical protein